MPKTKTAYIQANDIGEQLIKPEGVVVHVDEALVSRLTTLRHLCRTHGLASVSVRQSPDAWLPARLDEELHLNAPHLVVTRDSFWFEDQPKHARDPVECIPVHVDGLLAWFANDDAVLIASDDDEFDEYVKGAMKGVRPPPIAGEAAPIETVAPPLSMTDLMRRTLANFAGVGDVFSDAPECVGQVAAAQNLQVLAALLAGDNEVVSAGTLLDGPTKVSDVAIRADGSLVFQVPPEFDTAGSAWTVVTSTGRLYRVRHFTCEHGDSGSWLIEDAQSFYDDLLQGE